jgi:hypothetical protein
LAHCAQQVLLGQDARYQASDVLMELVKCHDKTYAKTAPRLLQQTRRSGSESFLIFLRSCPSVQATLPLRLCENITCMYGRDDATRLLLAKGFGNAANLPRQKSMEDLLKEKK